MFEESDCDDFVVLVNDEEQYSLWRSQKEIPTGWRLCGMAGSKDECSKYVDEIWTDMRPLSLRRQGSIKGNDKHSTFIY
jgi:MbtH protein